MLRRRRDSLRHLGWTARPRTRRWTTWRFTSLDVNVSGNTEMISFFIRTDGDVVKESKVPVDDIQNRPHPAQITWMTATDERQNDFMEHKVLVFMGLPDLSNLARG